MVRHRVRLGDQFRHIIFSSVAVTMRAAILVRFDNGRLREYTNTLVSTADRAVTSVIFGNMESDGEVIRAIDARVSPATKRGQTYVVMAVRDRNGLDVDELFRDYQYESSNVILDTFVDAGPGGGNGFIHTITGTNPAANVEVSETVPANALWRLLSFTVVLAQGETQTPTPNLIIDDGTTANRRIALIGATAQGASTTETHMWQRHTGGMLTTSAEQGLTDTDTLRLKYTTPVDIGFLPEGYRIRTVTSGRGANTDYAAPIFQVEEWIDP